MATDMTMAILIEIVDMLQMINKTIVELSEDILRDEIPLAGLDAAESEANEVTRWAELYTRTAKTLQDERLHINELEERVRSLETQLFKSMI
jgi:hypothetical protein